MKSHRYKVTTLGFVPSMMQQLLAHPMIDRVDFSSVLNIICGAAYLPREFAIKLVSLHRKPVIFTEGKEFLPLLPIPRGCSLICLLPFSGYGLSECVR